MSEGGCAGPVSIDYIGPPPCFVEARCISASLPGPDDLQMMCLPRNRDHVSRRTTRSHQTHPPNKNNVVATNTTHESMGSRGALSAPIHVAATRIGAATRNTRPRTRWD